MPFSFKPLKIREVVLIEPGIFEDARGFFVETYKLTDFSEFGIKNRFVQENHSKSCAKGVLRGLHFQIPPMAQAKLIKVLKGSILDVAVDIRNNSPSFGKWVSAVLSSDNKKMLYIPEGFAHGFCTLEENVEVLYKCSEVYSPEHDRGILWN
ncbi:MAG: dTDP-4-dehydrorhamnose 3,5-epimerase, partial [Candidatus Omnitrophica bacterium]|nr:dTDP-4-dehydrorhamnose 3,5-epimerase [Candidatus Omnitrophota bacterium]